MSFAMHTSRRHYSRGTTALFGLVFIASYALVAVLFTREYVERRHDVRVSATVVSIQAPGDDQISNAVRAMRVTMLDPRTGQEREVDAKPQVINSGKSGKRSSHRYETKTYEVGQVLPAYVTLGDSPSADTVHMAPPPGPMRLGLILLVLVLIAGLTAASFGRDLLRR